MGRKKLVSDEEVRNAARAVFVKQGLKASTKEIAHRAGLSEAALFQRYRTKADLFFAAMVPPAVNFSALFEGPDGQAGTEQEIEALSLGMLEYFRGAVPVLAQLISHPSFDFERFSKEHPGSPLDSLRNSLVQFLWKRRAEGKLGDIDVGAAALLLFGSMYSIAVFERMGAHGGPFPEALVREMARTLWKGIAERG